MTPVGPVVADRRVLGNTVIANDQRVGNSKGSIESISSRWSCRVHLSSLRNTRRQSNPIQSYRQRS